MHLNAVGGHRRGKTELHAECAQRERLRGVEPQTRIEGDIQQLPCDFSETELSLVLRDEAICPGMRRRDRWCSFGGLLRSKMISALRHPDGLRRRSEGLYSTGLDPVLLAIPKKKSIRHQLCYIPQSHGRRDRGRLRGQALGQ